ncbi:ZIP Zinc transporter [Botrytis cinerea]
MVVNRDVSSWSTSHLLAELARRQQDESAVPEKPVCGSGVKGSYNTSAHVYALVLILVLSTIACGFPLISRRSSKSEGPNRFIFLSQHFGTGVLIATAFVHLLPTAFMSLTDPCLPYFFSDGYHPLAGLIAMFSALVVRGRPFAFTRRELGRCARGENEGAQGNGSAKKKGKQANGRLGKMGLSRRPQDIALEDMGESEGLVAGVSPLPVSTPQIGLTESSERKKYQDANISDDESDLDLELDELDDPLTKAPTHSPHDPETSSSPISAEDSQKRQILQCLLLEAGILFHSIFIGMAISVATGPPFVVFLVAIAFHQSFEGLALGSRIAAINFPSSSPRPWLMVLAYGTTTPIGQAIGLIVHNLYDPHSAAGLLMVGFMNAISSGLLLFAGLVQLLAEDFLSDKSYGILKGRRRWEAFVAVLGGSCLMALVGAWA